MAQSFSHKNKVTKRARGGVGQNLKKVEGIQGVRDPLPTMCDFKVRKLKVNRGKYMETT